MTQLKAVTLFLPKTANQNCILCGETEYVKNDFCVECRAMSEELKVPRPHDFYDDDGREVDFLISSELAWIGRRLIQNYDDFGAISGAEIDFFWKAKGGATGGRSTLGKCKKVSGELKYYSEKDFLIWIAADNCFSFDYYKFVAIVFHELKHASRNPSNGKYEILGHDAELFNREVEIFGAWKSDLGATATAFSRIIQPKLFG